MIENTGCLEHRTSYKNLKNYDIMFGNNSVWIIVNELKLQIENHRQV